MTPLQALRDPDLATNMTIWRAGRVYRARTFNAEISRSIQRDKMGIGAILLTLAALYEDN
jgi:hypothetical protein